MAAHDAGSIARAVSVAPATSFKPASRKLTYHRSNEAKKQRKRVLLGRFHWNYLPERRSARLGGGPQHWVGRSFSRECAA